MENLLKVNPMPFVCFLVGLPASGKSTWLKDHSDSTVVVISSDDYIEARAKEQGITYDEAWDQHIKAADLHCFSTFRLALAQRLNIIIDRTNLTPRSRRRFTSLVPRTYEKTAIVFSLDRPTLDARLEARAKTGKTIPKTAIDEMFETFIVPSVEEGFANITFRYGDH